MRANTPSINPVRSVGPTRSGRSFVVRSPPLGLEINAVLLCRLKVKTNEIAVLRYVHASLENVTPGITRNRGIRQRKVVEQILCALVNQASGNNIAKILLAIW